MRILFYYSSNIDTVMGGVQSISRRLRNFFESNFYTVDVLCFYGGSSASVTSLPDQKKESSKKNIKYLRDKLLRDNYDILINQDGLSIESNKLIHTSTYHLDLRIISVFHNDIPLRRNLSIFKVHVPYVAIKLLYIFKYRKMYEDVFNYSKYVVFFTQANVDSFMTLFSDFRSKKDKIIIIPNALNLIETNNHYDHPKENRMLVVSRLENSQKNIFEILSIWKEFVSTNPNWTLDILGDGPDRVSYEIFLVKNEVRNVVFHGRKDPVFYYQRAKILLLTSNYEGFPLVIHEAQNYGVVPVLYNSFSAAQSMVQNKVNAILVRNLDRVSFLSVLKCLKEEPDYLLFLSSNAKLNSENYSFSNVGKRWIDLLSNNVC